ncbi:peptidyl-prolyl cis-trans isomerase [Spirochaetia bacterium]|nr:peptidyl-prolyl cis-trans isomerase [Spirochaetia bacterium]
MHELTLRRPANMLYKGMNIAKNRVVSIDYTLTDKDNEVLDSTSGAEAFEYLHGYENIIPGLEKALEGKTVGDSLKITIPAAEAYGEQDDTLIVSVPLDRFEGAGSIEAGMQFEAQTPDGCRMVTVTGVTEKTATVDGNYPLAGMDLTFDVTVKAIRDALPEEVSHGHVHGPHGHDEHDHHGHHH